MLQIHFSNRFEALVPLLLARLAATRGGPFEHDTVVVPSAAVGRALTLRLADSQGLASNLRLAYLAQWLWQQMARLLPDVPPQSPFAPPALAWRVYGLLGDAALWAGHPRLQRYLAGADAAMRHQLAQRVAGLIEPYSTYRPDLLAAWRDGQLPLGHPDEAWQAALWRRLCDDLALDSTHPARTFVDALRAVGTAGARAKGLPERLQVLALPTMAPLHIELLAELGRHMDIDLYTLNPCREYWFELVDARRLSRLAARGRAQGHEVGHRLLAAWGRQTQAHIDTLVDRCGDAVLDDAHYQPSAGDTLLARLQNSILALQDLAPGCAPLADGDRSVELHVCHSLTRELEVLQDRLLGLFAADPALRPGDVLVTLPDLEAASPLIDAVFGSVPPARHIPYAITGRGRSTANQPARTLLALLALAASRAPASECFGLLQQPLVARRLGLDAEDLQWLHRGLAEAGFRWGLSGPHRAGLGLPALPRHTLADALDRLFLGYAVAPSGAEPLGELLPSGEAEGSGALPLGALWHFARSLDRLQQVLQEAQTPGRWLALTLQACDDFLAADDDTLDDLRELQGTLRELAAAMAQGGLDDPLPLAVWRQAVEQALDDPARGGVPTGRVTFAAMPSLRGLPFAVVCLLGLDHEAFPGSDRAAEFDLMAAAPRRGDRQRRQDDRNLFLDLLLAARRHLHLSHSGRSVRDNSPRPPSVLVAELMDTLVPAATADAGDPRALAATRERLRVEHPLQPFSLAAFRIDADPRLRSHDGEIAQALRQSLAAPAAGPAPESVDTGDPDDLGEDDATVDDPLPAFFASPLPAPEPAWQQPTLDQLVEFFRQPGRFILRRRLGLALWQDDAALDDDEPFTPGRRQLDALQARLLPHALAGAGPAELRRRARAGVEWPDGALGARALDGALAELDTFAARVRGAAAEPTLPPFECSLPFDLDGQRWQLHADWSDLRAGGLLRWRAGAARAADRLQAWLHHLALCAAAPPGVDRRTRWLLRDATLAFRAPDDPSALLASLLRLYRRGLCEPLAFFPRSAWALVEGGATDARRAWTPGPQQPYAEGADAALRLAWRGRGEPLGADFERLAHVVYDPLRAHLEVP